MSKLLNSIKKRKLMSLLLLTVLLAAGTATAYAGFLYHKWNRTLDQMAAPPAAAAGNTVPGKVPVTQTSHTAPPNEDERQKPLTFLLTAIDEREGSEGSRNTDVMMLFRVDPQTHQGTVVSIPRDLEVTAEESGLSTSRKANYFYAYYYNKNKDTALYETKQLFSRVYDIEIDYMAVVNFDGFRKLVDELGGMMIDVDMDMRYQDESDGTDIRLKKGYQQLNGKQVLDFIRYRKSNLGTAESSDTERNQREQVVLNQMMDKLTALGGITAWGKVLDIMGSSIKTDIPADELRALTLAYRDYKPATVQYFHLNGEWESPYLVVKQQDLDEALQALRGESGYPIDSRMRTD
ncbi:LCP family protein [Paenibacillus sp. GCM10023248]|uniref:LCP family protein n=1 Tax=unclassified Paenibacillus TaxID=185978 RepID=UPI002379931A|nr:LCP family protein [Paenibacillus sp. MAHUQ-63]MDD9267661.1 LCP family protein [Paenibacillus sp. MAHUQ-63]